MCFKFYYLSTKIQPQNRLVCNSWCSCYH